MKKSRKMDQYVKDLFNAFCSVDSQFYFCEALADPQAVLNDEPNKKTLIQLTERHFSAELYSEWRQIIKQSPYNYTNLLIGFEVSKRFIRNEFVKDKASFRPDLILHQSQLDFNVNYQKIFVEIKTTFSLNRRKIKPDLNKIIFAIKQYSFENGVFIAINTNEERLLKLIKQLIAEYNLLYPDIINWNKFFLFYGNVEGVKWHKSFSEIYHS